MKFINSIPRQGVVSFQGRCRPSSISRAFIVNCANNNKQVPQFQRDQMPPNEDVKNGAEEIAKESKKAGNVAAESGNPMGGKGFEPPQNDGEGQGYSMKEVADCADSSNSGEEDCEGADAAEVE